MGRLRKETIGHAGRRKGDLLGGQQAETPNSSGRLIRELTLAGQKQNPKELPFSVCSALIFVKDNKGRAGLKGSMLLPIMMYRFAGLPPKGRCCLTEVTIHMSTVLSPASWHSASGNDSCLISLPLISQNFRFWSRNLYEDAVVVNLPATVS